jgi:hypothetical protein
MKYVFRRRHLVVMSALVGILLATAGSVYAATTIGTDISTGGNLTVTGTSHIGPDESQLPTLLQGYVAPASGLVTALINSNNGTFSGLGVESRVVTDTSSGEGVYSVIYGNDVAALEGDAYAAASDHSASEANAIYLSSHVVANNSVNQLAGAWIVSPDIGAGASAADVYGILIDDQTGGTNNYAIKTGLGKVDFGDTVNAPAYKVGGVAGLNRVLNLKGSDGNNCTETVTNGIITASTCP